MSLKKLFVVLLVFTIGLGVWIRSNGLDWDKNNLLHPDERFLVMLVSQLSLPDSLSQYLDTQTSPLNPHNHNTAFYVYGTLPLLLIKIFSSSTDLYQLLSLGRHTTAILDLATMFCVFFIGHRLGGKLLGFASASAYSMFALPIQLSRFFTVDPFVTFFGSLALCLLLYAHKYQFLWISSALFFAAAISSKVSGVFIGLPLAILLTVKIFQAWKSADRTRIIFSLALFVLSSIVTVRALYPYLFNGPISLNPQTLANFSELKRWESDTVWFPPAVQWTSITPGIFPLLHLAIIGLGLPMFALALLGWLMLIRESKKSPSILFVPVSIAGLIIYQSTQFAQPLRYLYPVYPLIAVCVGWILVKIYHFKPIICLVLIIVISIWPLSVASIYSRPHPRIEASNWIKSNIPNSAILSCDHWDDCLPVGYDHGYRHVELPMFDFETEQKWQSINEKLNTIDYLVISSNRVYASTQNDPRYLQTREFYEDLFTGRLNFQLVAQFASRPAIVNPFLNLCIPLPLLNYGTIANSVTDCSNIGVEFVDDYADETWTVYDHPKVFIFKNLLH